LELVFSIFWTYFCLKKKKKKKKRKEFEICFLYSFSGILYEPFLLLDALIDAHFAAFPAGAAKADDASSLGAVEDVEDVAKFVRGRPVGHIHEREYCDSCSSCGCGCSSREFVSSLANCSL
jgi:hypothetical protein